jgi:hypothetical protein
VTASPSPGAKKRWSGRYDWRKENMCKLYACFVWWYVPCVNPWVSFSCFRLLAVLLNWSWCVREGSACIVVWSFLVVSLCITKQDNKM